MVVVNGQEISWFEGMTILDLLNKLEIQPATVVVELNRSKIVPKEDFTTTSLQDGDHLEVVRFVGGG